MRKGEIVTPEQALQYLNGLLENVINCTGPERDKIRSAVNIIRTAIDENKPETTIHT
jgi:hypothetical protein